MRHVIPRIVAAIVCCLCLGFANASMATASSDTDTIVNSLKSSPVYIEPGTPTTTVDTPSYIKGFLNTDDHLLVVMLTKPSGSLEDIGHAVLASSSEKKTVALYADNQYVVLSNRIPTPAVNEAMNNAKAISMTPQETLATFIRQIHKWQVAHPEPTPKSTPAAVGGHSGRSALWVVLALVVLAGIGAAFFLVKREDGSDVRLKHTPTTLRDRIKEILLQSQQIDDSDVSTSLTNICKYTEAYFKNATADDNGDYQHTTDIASYLTRLHEVAAWYIKVHDEPMYYHDPDTSRAEYASAIHSFEHYMLDQVRNANEDKEFDVRQASQILSASELRTVRPSR